MATSPVLAIRCLMQLAIEGKIKNSKISRVIQQDLYVDDLFTGTSSIQKRKEIKERVTNILHSGGFELCNWISSESSILDNNQKAQSARDIGEEVKALSLTWESNEDNIWYKAIPAETKESSKRSILSTYNRYLTHSVWWAHVQFKQQS